MSFEDELKGLVNEEIDTFKHVDVADYVIEKIQNGDISVDEVAKFARIKARQGKVGEEIVTVMQDGHEETRNVVELDEKTGEPGWIVTNPGGEEYIITDANFKKKYEVDPENEKQYKPKGGPVMSVKTDEDISFVAPWGEEMRIKKGGALIVNSRDDIYGIQEKEFNDTYKSTGKDEKENLDRLKKIVDYEKEIEEKSKEDNVIE